MPQITVVAEVTAKPGCEAALTEVLSSLIEPTRQEGGCLRYDLHRDTQNPATLLFVETWTSREAHQAHKETPHFVAARSRQEGLVEQRWAKILEQI